MLIQRCIKESRSYNQLLTASHTDTPDAAKVVAIEINRLLSHSEKKKRNVTELKISL